ncbi:Protein phosphatase methylesterase 1 [Neolecta irregularis DAH-3]|uniref:Protein phosphatase methylesterase 1 n=1 Tax=Neolecta irregularis (strain DAH-3) TaxID=1198029 RepID=A0A1U7LGT6_NEOID|nr:Protein phosphatase methylesterase 1 [Neolecta irregularis DAH-3]|eukprot:OLL21859.1 Protein phosphatase methylesterase 1 [Neolecta irregularis DAH-3]
MSDLHRKLFQTSLPHLNECGDGGIKPTNGEQSTRNPMSLDKYFRDQCRIQTSSSVSLQVYSTLPEPIPDVVFVCHHGAGSSAASFAILARELESQNAGIIAFDARGHGESTLLTAQPLDLGLEILASDLVDLVKNIQLAQNWERLPNLVLVGHRKVSPYF